MTPLRQRMTEAMQIRNFTPNTQAAYLQQISRPGKVLSPVTGGIGGRAGSGLPVVSDQ